MTDLRHHGDREVGPGLLDFAVNVYAGPRPAWLTQALQASLDDLDAYPDPAGAEAAIARRHGVEPEQVVATAGAAEAFTLLARARRWRRPVVVHPQFTEPHQALELAGQEVSEVVLETPFSLVGVRIPDDADLVVLGNPTNPTGVLHARETVAALSRAGRTVVVDEAFMDCVPGEPESAIGLPGVVVIRSLTKQWGVPGVRAGYVLAEAGVADQLRAHRVPWSVSATAIATMRATATPLALEESERRAHAVRRWRAHLHAGLEIRGIEHVESSASFVLARVGHGVHAALRAAGIAVRRADTFPGLGPEWVRIAVRQESLTDALLAGLDDALG